MLFIEKIKECTNGLASIIVDYMELLFGLIWKVLNSSFMVAALGAAAGAFIVFYIEGKQKQKKEEEERVGTVNIFRATIYVTMMSLLLTKLQLLIPLKKETEEFLKTVKTSPEKAGSNEIRIREIIKKWQHAPFNFERNPKELWFLAARKSKVYLVLAHAVDSLETLNSIISDRNSWIGRKMVETPPTQNAINLDPAFVAFVDQIVAGEVEVIEVTIDHALWFLRKLDEEIEKQIQSVLNKACLEKLIELKGFEQEFECLMPPVDYLSLYD
jgi:hypothetical protein